MTSLRPITQQFEEHAPLRPWVWYLPILAPILVLAVIGVITIHAATPKQPFWSQQVIYLVVSLAALLGVQAINYRILGKYAWAFFILGALLTFYTVVANQVNGLPGCRNINGAFKWITFSLPGLGSFSVQPSELLKVAFIMVVARYLRFRGNFEKMWQMWPPFVAAVIPIGLILKQPDLGTAMIFIPTLLAMLFVAGAKIRHLLIVMIAGVALAPVAWLAGNPEVPVLKHFPVLIKDYQRARVNAMFSNSEQTLRETGFQQHNAVLHFSSGGVLGKGAGHVSQYPPVPESHNDMIFALVGEQFGLIGAFVTLVCYLVLFVAGIEYALRNSDPFARLMSTGLVAQLATQTFLNLTVALKLMPVTGVTLPFVSYGGSSLLASFIAAGLLLNLGRNRPFVMSR